MSKLKKSELKDLLLKNLPRVDDHGEVVETIGNGKIRIRLPIREDYLGNDIWGKTGDSIYSGPIVMGLADTAMYGCILSALGQNFIPVIVTFTINFLRPISANDLIAEARILRLGKRLVYLETYLYSDGTSEPVAHITSTYAIRDRRK